MNPEESLAYLDGLGLSIHLDGDDLVVSPPGRAKRNVLAFVRATKTALVAFLRERATQAIPEQPETVNAARDAIQSEFGRVLTDDEKIGVDLAFATLKRQHGGELVKAGWTRDVIFDGLDPTTCEKAGDVPGVIGLLMAGGRLVGIHTDRLELEFPDGEPLIKIRGGCLLAGEEREKFLKGVK